jgi:REP element-mobilizing transposase RayT
LDVAAVRDVETAMKNAEEPSGVRVLRSAILADHVHVLASFRPDGSLSDFVRLTKSGSAWRANSRIPGAVRWARGFYTASISKGDLSRVAGYIRGQHRRHPDRIPRVGRSSTDPGRQPGVHKSRMSIVEPDGSPSV